MRLEKGVLESKEYAAWSCAKRFCYNKNDFMYRTVGAHGIVMCDEWKNNPMAFINYIGKRPSSRHFLRRIDERGNYEPGNVEWRLFLPRQPEYNAWSHMKYACYNKNSYRYKTVGAAGIKVCKEWENDPVAFVSHVGKRPSTKHKLKRIDETKDFEPGNVGWFVGANYGHVYSGVGGEPKDRPKYPPEYIAWAAAKNRCYSTKGKFYKYYGGRGICMFEGWRDNFASFFEHIGPRPSPSHSLDRIDNDRGYEPGNVRWATKREQNINKSSNINIQICCHSKNLKEWCRIHDINYRTVRGRLKKGWGTLQAFGLLRHPNERLKQ